MKFNSIKFKISILYIIILGIILAAYSGFLYLSLRYTLYDELDSELGIKAREIASTIDSYVDALGHDQASFSFASKRVITFEGGYPEEEKIIGLEREWLQKVDKLDLKEDYIDLLNINGEPLVRSGNLQGKVLPLSLKDKAKIQEGKPLFKSLKFDKRNLRTISVPFSYTENEQYIIQVGTSLKPVIQLLQLRLMHIAISIPVFLLFASFLGRIFVARLLNPVMEITKTANKITHEDLSSRVKAEHVDEEMKYLVDAFNDMISRLERSFKYIAEFSSHVAHDLKTPLAIIKGESELSLRKDRSPDEYKRAIKISLEEVERMFRVIEDLLLLTRLDYQQDSSKFERFDLSELLWEICEQSKILASQKNIAVNINIPQSQFFINGDRIRLRRLFFNLIDNAIKFNKENGEINISARDQDGKIIVSVSDTGAGIAKENLPKIFDRFFHADSPGGQPESGTGLGLSIVQSIAKIHRGKIEVKSSPAHGSTFMLTLPLA